MPQASVHPRSFGPYPCDENSVPSYHLPDPLARPDGRKVTTAQEWMTHQRRNILEIFKKYEYGEILSRPDSLRFEVLSEKADALDGLALRREIRIHATMNNGRRVSFDMLLYLPQKAQGPVPAFLGLNFKGNHATTSEDDVRPTGTDDPRGCQEGRWCFRECAERGYASATICYHELFRDETGFADSSVFSLFHDKVDMREIGENYTPIGAWAWGLSRGLDCLEAQPEIRQGAVAVHGHSRLGKTALWAGAIDQRFAMVISNDSGCGGGALHRRKYGENLSQHFQSHLDSHVPVWFVNRLGEYMWREEELPFDQHELLALVAPRPLALATATLDQSADPRGEFAAARAASVVWKLFGSQGLPVKEMPPPDTPVTGGVSFHCRTGKHDQTREDWLHYWHLADVFLK